MKTAIHTHGTCINTHTSKRKGGWEEEKKNTFIQVMERNDFLIKDLLLLFLIVCMEGLSVDVCT